MAKDPSERRALGLTRALIVLGAVVFLAVVVTLSSSTRSSKHAIPESSNSTMPFSPRPSRPPLCRSGDVLANVYKPSRLRIEAPCKTITGVVRSKRHEPDGDWHIDVQLDSSLGWMLNPVNLRQQHGWIVIEITPADLPGCAAGQPLPPSVDLKDLGVCTGADVPVPRVGDRIRATGAFVTDRNHGWREIHPVWALVIVS